MTENLVWLNGSLLPVSQARLLVTDRGFLAGDGVFEAVKVIAGQPFALGRHLRRLRRSAAVMRLPSPEKAEKAEKAEERLREAVADTVAANRSRCGDAARARITWTAGAGEGIYRRPGESTLLITVDPLPVLPEFASVTISPWPRNDRSVLAGAKTTSYAENAAILAYARDRGHDEAILADTRGRLSEGTTCNVVVVIDGELFTPTPKTGCLEGVTRELAIEWGLVNERDMPISVLKTATEVLLASTTRDLQPVRRIDDRVLPGPVSASALGLSAPTAAPASAGQTAAPAPAPVTAGQAAIAEFRRRARISSEP